MNFLQFSFYLFSAILIVAASLVVTVRNPVKAALYLVLVFFSAACIWLTLEAEFLAIVLVLVYVGAVMVLFLFVVMMLDIDVARLREGFTQYLPAGLVILGWIQMWTGSSTKQCPLSTSRASKWCSTGPHSSAPLELRRMQLLVEPKWITFSLNSLTLVSRRIHCNVALCCRSL